MYGYFAKLKLFRFGSISQELKIRRKNNCRIEPIEVWSNFKGTNFTICSIFVDITRKPLLARKVYAQTFCREFKGVSNAGFKINVSLKLWKLL